MSAPTIETPSSGVRVNDYSSERPPIPIIAPAVTRSLMFRLDANHNPRWKVDWQKRKPLWLALCKMLEFQVNGVLEQFGNPERVEFQSRPGTDAQLRNPSAKLRFLNQSCIIPICESGAKGFRFRIRIDVYQEFCSVGFLFDKITKTELAKFGLASFEQCSDPNNVRKAFDHIFIGTNFRTLLDAGSPEFPLLGCLSVAGRATLCGESPEEVFGRLQADFRGIILQSGWRGVTPEKTSFVPVVTTQTAPALSGWLAGYLVKHDKMIRAVAAPHEAENDASKGGEAIICGMLNGAALYAAQLGRWGQAGDDMPFVPPVRHLIVYNGSSAAQLGRLERRLHVLGELRHAALIDYDNVGSDHEANSDDRNESDNAISSASRRIRDLGKYVDHTTRKYTDAVTGRMDIDIRKLNRFVTELGEINYKTDESLLFRAEQARYYSHTYRDLVDHLRVIKIGEFQPYNEFVKRYFFHMFDRIERVARRYENMGRRIDRLLYYKQAESADSYQKAVAASVKQLVGVTDALNANTARSGHLLETGENVGWLIATYYLGNAIKEVYPKYVNGYLEGLKFPYLEHVIGLISMAWIACLALLAFKAVLAARKMGAEGRRR